MRDLERVLITGATGFVGHHLVKRLAKEGCEVHVLVRPDSGNPWSEPVSDVLIRHVYDNSYTMMERAVRAARPQAVIHLAGLFVAEHKPGDVTPLVETNILMGAHLLEAMRVCGVSRLIGTGTNWQHYFDANYEPMDFYAATKQAFEDLAAYYVKACGLSMITLKLYDTYGPEDRRKKLLYVLNRARQSGELLSMSPGAQRLGLVHVDDVVQGYLKTIAILMEEPEGVSRAYCLPAEQFLSLRDIVSLYEEVYQCRLPIQWGGLPYRQREIMCPYVGEILPGWRPQISLKAGLEALRDLEL